MPVSETLRATLSGTDNLSSKLDDIAESALDVASGFNEAAASAEAFQSRLDEVGDEAGQADRKVSSLNRSVAASEAAFLSAGPAAQAYAEAIDDIDNKDVDAPDLSETEGADLNYEAVVDEESFLKAREAAETLPDEKTLTYRAEGEPAQQAQEQPQQPAPPEGGGGGGGGGGSRLAGLITPEIEGLFSNRMFAPEFSPTAGLSGIKAPWQDEGAAPAGASALTAPDSPFDEDEVRRVVQKATPDADHQEIYRAVNDVVEDDDMRGETIREAVRRVERQPGSGYSGLDDSGGLGSSRRGLRGRLGDRLSGVRDTGSRIAEGFEEHLKGSHLEIPFKIRTDSIPFLGDTVDAGVKWDFPKDKISRGDLIPEKAWFGQHLDTSSIPLLGNMMPSHSVYPQFTNLKEGGMQAAIPDSLSVVSQSNLENIPLLGRALQGNLSQTFKFDKIGLPEGLRKLLEGDEESVTDGGERIGFGKATRYRLLNFWHSMNDLSSSFMNRVGGGIDIPLNVEDRNNTLRWIRRSMPSLTVNVLHETISGIRGKMPGLGARGGGIPGMPDFGSWFAGFGEMTKTSAIIGKWTGAFDGLMEQGGQVAEIMTKVGNVTGKAVSMATKLGTKATSAFSALSGAIGTIPAIGVVAVGALAGVITAVNVLIAAVTALAAAVAGVLTAFAGIAAVAAAVVGVGLFQKGEEMAKNSEDIESAWQGVMEYVKTFSDEVRQALEPIFQLTDGQFFGGFLKGAIGVIEQFSNLVEQLWPEVQGMFDRLGSSWGEVQPEFFKQLEGVIRTYMPMVEGFLNAIITGMPGALNFMQKAKPALDALLRMFGSIWDAIEPLLPSGIALVQIISDIGTIIAEVLTPFIELLALVLNPAMMGFAWIVDKVAAGVKWLSDTLSGFFDFINKVIGKGADWFGDLSAGLNAMMTYLIDYTVWYINKKLGGPIDNALGSTDEWLGQFGKPGGRGQQPNNKGFGGGKPDPSNYVPQSSSRDPYQNSGVTVNVDGGSDMSQRDMQYAVEDAMGGSSQSRRSTTGQN